MASSRIANWVRNKLSNEQISDAGCTYRAFRRECVEKLKLYRGLHRFIPTLLKMEGFTDHGNPRHEQSQPARRKQIRRMEPAVQKFPRSAGDTLDEEPDAGI